MDDALDFDPIAEARRQWQAHWDDPPADAMHAVTSIMRVQQILLARLNETLRPFDLTFPRYEVLVLLHFSRRGALPLGKMGARLQVHRTSLTSLVEGLERLGFVRREPHESDGRTTMAVLTEPGRAAALAATEALHESSFETAPLSGDDLRALSSLLERYRAADP